MVLEKVKVFCSGKFTDCSDLEIENGKIKSITNVNGEPNGYLVPGFIDIHTHGAMGEDVMNATPEAIQKISAYHATHGTTTFCPTTLTASIPDTIRAVQNVSHSKCNGARIAGIHLEGPFLSPAASGAHPKNLLLIPNSSNTGFIISNAAAIRRITIAPDLDDAEYLAKLCADLGIQVSLGHDGAIDDEIYACVNVGASSVTHLYNCTSRPSRRTTPKKHLGLTEIGLIDERLVAEVIADGKHVPDELFKMIYKLKGASGIALISDSLSVAGMPDGDYLLGAGASAKTIRIEDGVAVLPAENTYAGSVVTVGEIVTRIAKLGLIPFDDLITMATLTPAKLTGLTDRGDIKTGYLADFNLLDEEYNITKTYIGGEIYG